MTLLFGRPIEGTWTARSEKWEEPQAAATPPQGRLHQEVVRKTSLDLAPLPCWQRAAASRSRGPKSAR